MNTLSGLVHAGNVEEIYELSISRLPTEQYDSLPARKVSFHQSRKAFSSTLLIIIPIVLG